MEIFLKGLILGFSIAAPVGPIGLLCIQRTLSRGRAAGFFSGLGAATADGCYGAVAALGLTAVSSFLIDYGRPIRLGGGLFLLWLGGRILLRRRTAGEGLPASGGARGGAEAAGLLGAFGSTFLLTIANPMTILSFAAVFAGMGLIGRGGGLPLVGGVFVGSCLWWLLLSLGVGLFRRRIGPRALLWIDRLSGVCLVAFGLWASAGPLLGG